MDESRKKIKITLVDDEKGLVETIRELLEARNFLVSVAYDGHHGLEVIKQERPDLIILDIMMPRMDGRDLLIHLKKDESLKNIPVIMLTARAEQFDRSYGIKLGAHEYLAKPYDANRLLRQINSILEKEGKK